MPHVEQLVAGERTARVHLRIPDGATAGVVVLHAWWGLNDDVIAYADRLADAGYAVAAPDMFEGQVATERADADRLSGEHESGGVEAIVLAAVDFLAERLGADARLAVLGFSFGAGYAIWAPSERQSLAATVVYYGAWAGPFLSRSKAALLGHFAEEDEFTSDDEIREMEEAYRAAGLEATVHRYPGTGHWFAEPSRDAYRAEAAELAFERTLSFLRQHLTVASAAPR
jgi:carboxymethylenebutenolidase